MYLIGDDDDDDYDDLSNKSSTAATYLPSFLCYEWFEILDTDVGMSTTLDLSRFVWLQTLETNKTNRFVWRNRPARVLIYTTIAGLSLKSVLTNMSFSSCAAAFRQRSSPKSQVMFASVFSGIGDFLYFWDSYFLCYGEFAFFEFKCMLLRSCSRWKQSTASYLCIKIGDSRLRTVASAAGLWGRSPLYLIGDAASRRGLCTGRVFHPTWTTCFNSTRGNTRAPLVSYCGCWIVSKK